jgi:hypothetical protein
MGDHQHDSIRTSRAPGRALGRGVGAPSGDDGASIEAQSSEVRAVGGDAWDALRWARNQTPESLDGANTELLVLRATALDAALLGGAWRATPEIERRTARTLVQIYDALCARPPAELGARRDSDSPLDTLVDDVPPFGHRDLWTTFLHRAPPVHRRPEPTPTPSPSPGPEPRPVEPVPEVRDSDIGDEAGDQIGAAGVRPEDPTGGPSDVDLAQTALDVVGTFVEASVLEVLGVLSTVYSFWAHFLTLEQAAQQERAAMSAWGVRHGIIALDLMPTPYPDVLRKEDLRALIEHTVEWQRDWNLVAYPVTGPEVHTALLRGLTQVATAVNGAFARFEARVRDAAPTAPPAALRAAIEAGRTRIVDEIVRQSRSRFEAADAARP